MIRLLRVELRRYRWRRAVVLLIVTGFLISGILLAALAWDTRPVSDADLRDAQAQLEQVADDPVYAREVRRCEQRPARYGAQDAAECADLLGPQLEWFLDRPQLDLAGVRQNQGFAVVIVVGGLLALAATTFVGADWNSGSMSNQLLFESRRLRIWSAKALAVMVWSAGVLAVLLGLFWAAVGMLARTRGIDTPPGVVDSIQGAALRGVLLVAVGAVAAYALTMLFRSTVFTLGTMFVLVVGSTIALAAFGISEQWMPHVNVSAVLDDGARYYREVDPACFEPGAAPTGVDCRQYGVVTLLEGVRYLALPVVLVALVSLWSFRRRDVP